MTISNILVRAAIFLACIALGLAQPLPYNPDYLVQADDSKIYLFSSSTSPQFAVYDVTNSINSEDAPEALTNELPFLTNSSNSFVPVATRNGLTIFSGECAGGDQQLDLWTYGFGANNKTWTQMRTTSNDAAIGANYLSAAFSFPMTGMQDSDSVYVFGGMCPDGTEDTSNWATNAIYSNTMLTISPEQGQDYEVSLTGQRAAPVAEAGLTITPLIPSRITQEGPTQQQNFVLIGGHTQSAFINMSQVAMFSMPEQAWAFIGINQPSGAVVEPRSGHTAVMSEDGSRIYVFGGWVGAVTNPATPQLAILEVGTGYGGNGSWSWTIPDQNTVRQYSGDYGVYGHAATMLPGDVMMVTGGLPISPQAGKRRRDDVTFKTKFYNTTASTWDTVYTNPVTRAATNPSKSGMSTAEKSGLGAGLGVGIAVILAIVAIWFLHTRRKRRQRAAREKQLREMALGTDRSFPAFHENNKSASRTIFSGYRSASWGARQEQNIEASGSYPTCRQVTPEDMADSDEDHVYAQSGMLDVPNPNRTQRTSLRARGGAGFGSQIFQASNASGAVFTIKEEEERSQPGSIRRPNTTESRPLSDPFKDPPTVSQTDEAAQQRRQEVQTWVEDWASAAESMNLERSTSKANSRTYSNLSAYHSTSSGDKSDRSNSNLSERSNISNLSIQRSNAGTVSRTLSQRSGSAGYALFSSAAAAMSRMAGRPEQGSLDRTASKRSISTGDLAQMKARKRGNSVEQGHAPAIPIIKGTTPREENGGPDYFTPPESPIKDYKNHSRRRSNSLTSQSIKALGVLGHATKRVLTGTGGVNVSNRIDNIEANGDRTSPKRSDEPEMSEIQDRRAASSGAAFWKHKQGAKDWEDPELERSATIRRRSGRVQREVEIDEPTDDWDVETAIQQRVVQVMFTVPKEKLRVVNADNLSLISRSDTNASRSSEKSDEGRDVKRMSRLTEAGEAEDEGSTLVGRGLHPDSADIEKGKAKTVERAHSGASGATIGKAL